jgi:hypothetical protein
LLEAALNVLHLADRLAPVISKAMRELGKAYETVSEPIQCIDTGALHCVRVP